MKKIISCLILCAMLLSLIPLSISAEGTTVTMTEFDTSATYDDGTVVTIADKTELDLFNGYLATQGSNSGGVFYFAKLEVKLLANIDYENGSWTSKLFQGTFNGNGKKISNIVADTGFFKEASGSIENLTLDTLVVESSGGNVGGLVSARTYLPIKSDDLTISNVHLVNATVGGTSYIGGFIGNTNGDNTSGSISILNSSFQGTVTSSSGTVGGFIGYVTNTVSINMENCYFNGSIEGTETNVGYLIGRTRRSTTITNCHSYTDSVANAVGASDDGVIKSADAQISNPVVVGYQEKTNTDGSTDYRFVAAVALPEGKTISDYTDIGFYVTLTKNGAASSYNNTKVSCYNVYTSVSGTKEGDNEPTVYKASNFGADYLFVVVFEGVPAENNNFEVTLTPYLTPAEGDELVGAADTLKKN